MIDEQVVALAHQAIEKRIFPGCVLGLMDTGRQEVRAIGKPTYESRSCLSECSIYDVASLTKTIVTATLMHLLIDEGRCGLTEPVCRYIPELLQMRKMGC